VDHPVIRPSIAAVAATYDLAVADPNWPRVVGYFWSHRQQVPPRHHQRR
jgi:aromatic ring hydroxylase